MEVLVLVLELDELASDVSVDLVDIDFVEGELTDFLLELVVVVLEDGNGLLALDETEFLVVLLQFQVLDLLDQAFSAQGLDL